MWPQEWAFSFIQKYFSQELAVQSVNFLIVIENLVACKDVSRERRFRFESQLVIDIVVLAEAIFVI